jgi:nitroimidazol reductase NimA-like FMN-containing flavoprotein (pyridoxamine 5'-phosphate oxidase superfamily)
MADYGVPEDLEGVLPWSWAAERLVRCRNYWLVTASAAARPHAMPVWGVWLDAAELFAFSCATSARKARNLAANPQVVVAIDDTVECVSVEGTARFASASETDRAIAAYLAKYEPDPAKHADMEGFLRSNPFYAVEPERAFGVIEREDEFGPRATRWVW